MIDGQKKVKVKGTHSIRREEPFGRMPSAYLVWGLFLLLSVVISAGLSYYLPTSALVRTVRGAILRNTLSFWDSRSRPGTLDIHAALIWKAKEDRRRKVAKIILVHLCACYHAIDDIRSYIDQRYSRLLT